MSYYHESWTSRLFNLTRDVQAKRVRTNMSGTDRLKSTKVLFGKTYSFLSKDLCSVEKGVQ